MKDGEVVITLPKNREAIPNGGERRNTISRRLLFISSLDRVLSLQQVFLNRPLKYDQIPNITRDIRNCFPERPYIH
jgi:hypothetical protein